MPHSYYIYYRVAQRAQAQTLVRQILASVKAGTGIDGRLLSKRGNPSTWLEIYEDVQDAGVFEQCLAAAVRTANFEAVLVNGDTRHMECFEDSCA